jgi:tungstate transport system ATP-binding protein
MTSEYPLYLLRDLKYRYGRYFELDMAELTIDHGSSVGFVGANGCGKTTLLRLLAFIEMPHEGQIYFNGKDMGRNNNSVTKQEVTMLLQEPYLLKRSVFENVAFGLKVRDDRKKLKERVYDVMKLVGLAPKDFARRKWYELSGGEAQRIALASRLILKPRVLILDEPTASVDQESAFLIKQAITECRSQFGMSLVIASHDRVWLNSVTDTIQRIHEGRIVGTGSENLIPGPWEEKKEGLFVKTLTDGQSVHATKPFRVDSAGILNPSDIAISLTRQDDISAQNMLRGFVSQMTIEKDSENVLVDVEVAGLSLLCRLTKPGVEKLQLIPGKEVWAFFKASSVNWY